MTDDNKPTSGVTPFGVVKLILLLLISVTALLVVLTLLGLLAWFTLWGLLLKLGAAAAVIAIAALLISRLMK